MSRTIGLLALLALAACFDPRYREGLACSDAGTCPPGQMCGGDSRCHSGSVDLATPDDLAADLAIDLGLDLAPDLASPGPRCPPLSALGGAQAGQFCGNNGPTDADPNAVYLCTTATASGPPARGYLCPLGCVKRPMGMDDYCNAGNCSAGLAGNYCGTNGLAGDPMALYHCAGPGQTATYLGYCKNGCSAQPPGTNDFCK